MSSSSYIRRAGPPWLGVLAVLFLGAIADEGGAEGYGPFPVRNFQPIQLQFLGMYGDRAAVIPKGTLDVQVELAETATVFEERTNRASARAKFETLRSALFLRYGLLRRVEVSVEVPLLYRYGGFLEGAITATERATTGLAGPRQRLDGTGFVFDIRRDGRLLFGGGDGELGLGDISLHGKWQVWDERETRPAAALRLAVKVPSGDEGRVFGSGHADVGIGAALEKQLATRWLVYGNASAVFPTGRVSALGLGPIPSGLAAVEYLWTPAFSLTLQFEYYGTPFDGTGAKLLDRGVTEVTAGFNYRLRDNVLWRVYGVENVDLITDSAADFTVSTVVIFRFGT